MREHSFFVSLSKFPSVNSQAQQIFNSVITSTQLNLSFYSVILSIIIHVSHKQSVFFEAQFFIYSSVVYPDIFVLSPQIQVSFTYYFLYFEHYSSATLEDMALVSNFSGFCLSANALHLTSNLNRVFAGKILFLLSLEVLVDCLLVSGTSGGKSTFIYIVSLSAVYYFSSPATSKPVFFFFVFVLQQFSCELFRHGFRCIYLVWCFLCL